MFAVLKTTRMNISLSPISIEKLVKKEMIGYTSNPIWGIYRRDEIKSLRISWSPHQYQGYKKDMKNWQSEWKETYLQKELYSACGASTNVNWISRKTSHQGTCKNPKSYSQTVNFNQLHLHTVISNLTSSPRSTKTPS